MGGITFKLAVRVKITESQSKKGPREIKEEDRQTDVDRKLENTLIITAHIAYFLGKYIFGAVPRIHSLHLWLTRNA